MTSYPRGGLKMTPTFISKSAAIQGRFSHLEQVKVTFWCTACGHWHMVGGGDHTEFMRPRATRTPGGQAPSGQDGLRRRAEQKVV